MMSLGHGLRELEDLVQFLDCRLATSRLSMAVPDLTRALALRKPRHVDVEVLDPGGHASPGSVAGAAREHLILSVVEEPELRVVVRFRRRHCDAKLERLRGDHPGKTIERMASERSGAGPTLGEHLGDKCSCLLPSHLGASLYGESFVGEQRRSDGELDWLRLFAIEVDGKSWGQSSDPPGGEPTEGALDAFC